MVHDVNRTLGYAGRPEPTQGRGAARRPVACRGAGARRLRDQCPEPLAETSPLLRHWFSYFPRSAYVLVCHSNLTATSHGYDGFTGLVSRETVSTRGAPSPVSRETNASQAVPG